MKRKILAAGAASALFVGLLAGPAAAARPSTPDTACLQAGLAVLQTLPGGVAGVAQDGLEFGGQTLALNQVLRAHLFSPELFPWCN